MSTTTNYDFKTRRIGHPVRDTDIADTLNLIDARIKDREDENAAAAALPNSKILVGNAENVATAVYMQGHVTNFNTGQTVLKPALLKGIITAELSFEDACQTATKIYFPYAVTITTIRGIVMKPIDATNDGTITGANSVGNSENGVLTAAAGDVVDVEYEVSPTSRNHVDAGSYYKLTSSKPAPGGIVLVTLEYIRTD